MHDKGTKRRRKIAENFNRLSRVYERYRQTDDRQTDGRQHIANVHVSSLSRKTTNVCDVDARSVGGERNWLAGDTDGLAGWLVMVGVFEVGVVDTRYGVSQPGADAERYRCACLYTAHRGWLGVVTGISAASTGGRSSIQ